MVHTWERGQKAKLEPERAGKARFGSLEILRGKCPSNTLHVATKEEIETGAHNRRLSQAGGVPVLKHVVGGTAVLPDTVRDEGYEKIVRAGAVEVFRADNQGGAFFPATRGV